ncbi:MAG: hypothetical protein WA840_15630 [Caulobacteraceae bacterium]
MRSLIVAAFTLSMIAAPAFAGPCKDARGKFIKCPPPIMKRCKDMHGKFMKCGMPGARPY